MKAQSSLQSMLSLQPQKGPMEKENAVIGSNGAQGLGSATASAKEISGSNEGRKTVTARQMVVALEGIVEALKAKNSPEVVNFRQNERSRITNFVAKYLGCNTVS